MSSPVSLTFTFDNDIQVDINASKNLSTTDLTKLVYLIYQINRGKLMNLCLEASKEKYPQNYRQIVAGIMDSNSNDGEKSAVCIMPSEVFLSRMAR